MFSTDGQAVDFATPDGPYAIHYAELKVTDSRLREVPAYMEGFSRDGLRGIRIVMDDREAVYPLTVDPLATSPAWMGESDQAGASFGESVATAGDVNGDLYGDVIVGAMFYDNGQVDEGRIYVYHGSASGLSSSPAAIREINVANTQFGRSVSTAGDVNGDGFSDVIAGAPYDDNGEYDEGRAYAYYGSASGIAASPSWIGEINEVQAQFGVSVSTAGDVNGDGYGDVIVGAPKKDYTPIPGILDSGAVYIYYGSASGLPSSPSSWRLNNEASSDFGASVAWAGDVNGDSYGDVVVGAHLSAGGGTHRGAVYLYAGSSTGPNWDGMWGTVGEQDGSEFGHAVATAGDVNGDGYSDIIVSAKYYANGQAGEGKAYVFYGPSPTSTASWSQEGESESAFFGQSVGTAGDVNGDGYADVVIGAYGFTNDLSHEGRAYVYLGASSGLNTSSAWIGEGNQAAADYGVSVGTAGDVNGDGYSDVIVGAWRYDNVQTDEGAAFVYLGSAASLLSAAQWYKSEHELNGQFGYSVASAGDVNGDGYADVIVGAPNYDNGGVDSGSVFAYYGSSSGLATSSSWANGVNASSARYGEAVASAGDVNGDGYDDVIVGAPTLTNNLSQQGRAFLYLGSSSGLTSYISWMQDGWSGVLTFGHSVASAGDVNGDGYADVIIGGGSAAWAYYGSPAGLPAHWDWTFGGAEPVSVAASAGDVNGDGYFDVVVGAPSATNGQTGEGRAHVFHGSPTGLHTSADWSAEGNLASAGFGVSVATAGDVNGDGYSDVIVGAPGYTNGASGEGKAFVYHGSASGLAATAAWGVEGSLVSAGFGHSVSTAGDVNGDGYADVVVGAPGYQASYAGEGMAQVFLGSAAGLSSGATRSYFGSQTNAHFGDAVASAGDVNGDGYADVVAGAYGYDDAGGWTDAGLVRLYYGNGGPGVAPRPRQIRVGDSEPIAEHGMSDGRTNFGLQLKLRSPFGRSMAKLEYEAKPLGVLFDRSGLGRGATWASTGSSGSTRYEEVTGTSQSAAYHWRMRVLYRPATSPFQQWSRWMTLPWGGWQEMRLRTYSVDADTDGYHDIEDCNDANGNVWSDPTAETQNLLWGADETFLSWNAVTSGLGCVPAALVYDVLRSGTSSSFTSASCLDPDGDDTSAREFSNPSVGQAWYYLVRADNACSGAGGPLGNQSNGTPRTGRSCP